ncbi:MAG TPA: hypothetical protein VKX17_17405 [Planctomycetota bacterium]|nr:hypothetical protein [Planctomycetota bacterium]
MDRDIAANLDEGAELLRAAEPAITERFAALARRLRSHEWTVLVSGLCSVGKSSVVCALWGDAELLPTAVRDCTQTNTLIRVPAADELDRRIFLNYLDRRAAENFALRGLAFHRLTEMLEEYHGVAMPRLDEMLPDARLRFVAADARKLYASRRDLSVLNEPLSEELEQLEQFIAFLDSEEYQPGARIEAKWEERREHLMGKRLLDGRLAGTGKLMALEHVEIVRESEWNSCGSLRSPAAGGTPAVQTPVLIDTPWIPTVHNARREDLILERARGADVLLVLSLPKLYEPENWLLKILVERPELARSTVVLFNQIDTCDPRTLFSRDGFAGIYAENRERLVKLGIDPANILLACARLRFLKDSQQSDAAGAETKNPFGAASIAERIARLEKVLGQLREQAKGRGESELRSKFLAACDVNDAGVETLRRRLEELAAGIVAKRREAEALGAMIEAAPVGLAAENAAAWGKLRGKILKMKVGQ